MPPPSLRDEFAAFAGELAESLSFNRSIGQIYGFLYLSREPLSLGEISRCLKMSKGNASINLRTLESWQAVYPVPVAGSRQDHYEANRDLKMIALRRFKDGFGKRLDLAENHLGRLLKRGDGSPEAKKSLQNLRSLLAGGRRLLVLLPKMSKFLPG
jgi:DNA-binding transcriptional regulator GbsR (MarR family)